MVRCKRWPVMQDDAPPDVAAGGWNFQAEWDALAPLCNAVEVYIPRRVLPDRPTAGDVLALQGSYGGPLFGPECVVTAVEPADNRWRVAFDHCQIGQTWGFKTRFAMDFTWDCHWPAVAAHRRAALGYPDVPAGAAAAAFLTTLQRGTPKPMFAQLRLYGMPVAFTASGDAVTQVSPTKFVSQRRNTVGNYRVGCVVHPQPEALLPDLVAALPRPVLVVVPRVDAAQLGPDDMALEHLTAADPKAVRRAMKAARAVYVPAGVYRGAMVHREPGAEVNKLEHAGERRRLGVATTLQDIPWGGVLTVQTTAQDIIAPPGRAFHCAAMTPTVWDLLERVGTRAYDFTGDSYTREWPRYALAHVTLEFPDQP